MTNLKAALFNILNSLVQLVYSRFYLSISIIHEFYFINGVLLYILFYALYN